MSLRYFPLRWEGTGDQWWYASPIDCAAANGHYDLVRELLRIDNNHLFKLTSLRRIHRLELMWDDEEQEQFSGIAKCRSEVAQKLLHECESNRGTKKKKKNSLICSGYGGWLMYTAASAGDLCFVQQLLEINPFLVFGEGEYSVTDIFYAASRGKNCEVFMLLLDFAVCSRFVGGKGEHVGEISSVYKWEMINRAVHGAARGGNVEILERLLVNCSDVLAYRDAQGSTILHSAAGRGKIEVVKYLTSSFDIINSTDHQGNTALHVATYKGQLTAVEILVSASSTLISLRNSTGETFLHKAISGFQSPAFRRLDKQVDLLRKLLTDKKFHIEEIINAENTDGRTAHHIATMGNIQTDIVKLLMTVPLINVNVTDVDGMTPLDYLMQSPNSSISSVLVRKLISAGGIFHSKGYHNSRKSTTSQIKMHKGCNSPGTSFRISDTQMFMYTGIENALDGGSTSDQGSAGMSSNTSFEHTPYDSATENNRPSNSSKKSSAINNAAAGLKRVLQWHPLMEKKKKSMDRVSDETQTSLRQRFFRHSTLPNNKRSFCVRSYQSSPNARKRFASGVVPQVKVSRRSHSSSFSISSISSPISIEKQKGIVCNNSDHVAPGPSSFSGLHDGESPNFGKRDSASKKIKGHYFCFGEPSLDVKTSVKRQQKSHS